MSSRPFAAALAPALALGLLLAPALSVANEGQPIFSAPLAANEATKAKRFAINDQLGRAWVEVEVWHLNSDVSDLHRVQVPGLYYDRDTRKVVFEADGEQVVCANARDPGGLLFRHPRLEPTGDCELTRRYVKVPVDNGFGVDVVERFEVHFNPVRRVGMTPLVTDAPGS